MASMVEHLINGRKVMGNGDRRQDLYNPATGEITGQVALASAATVEEAISAAEAAFPRRRNVRKSYFATRICWKNMPMKLICC